MPVDQDVAFDAALSFAASYDVLKSDCKRLSVQHNAHHVRIEIQPETTLTLQGAVL